MKKTKRYLALMTAGFLAVTPMAATGLTAVAETHTLTVTDTESATHTYTAYPIITGTKHADGSFTDIAWGTGIRSTALINALESNKTALGITIPSSAYVDGSEIDSETGKPIKVFDPTKVSIDDVAEILAGISSADKIEKLAKILNDTANILGTGTSLTKSGDSYSATVADGWYLVVDSSTLDDTNGPKVRSANLLQIIGNITVNAKHSLPTLEKKIYNGTAEVDQNTASVGDVITYHIKTKVPDMRGYDKYFFIIEDTLSAGLTYNSVTSIQVLDPTSGTVKGTLTKDNDSDYTLANCNADYYVDATTPSDVKIVFENVINRLSTYSAGDDIVVTYTATLNSNADITDTGNTNSAKLIYSKDPNVTATGKSISTPDEPNPPSGGDPGDVVGETPNDTVKTYTTAIKIKKVDQSGKVLEGAAFTLTGTSSGQAVVIKNTFTANESGTYWKLKNGTFTTTNPEDTGVDATLYDDTEKKYSLSTSTELKGTGQTVSTIVSDVGTDGYIVFKGLGEGNYTLTESTVPTGYNSIDPISFSITASPDASSANWTTPTGFTADGGMFLKTIENRKGSILPTTGGIGTKLFYIFGGLLVAGSVVFLVTKKRMSTKEN